MPRVRHAYELRDVLELRLGRLRAPRAQDHQERTPELHLPDVSGTGFLMALSPAEKSRRHRERRAGMCQTCRLVCMRCGERCIDDIGRYVPHNCPKPDVVPAKANCQSCIDGIADRRKRAKGAAAPVDN